MRVFIGAWLLFGLAAPALADGRVDGPRVVVSIKPIHGLVAGLMDGIGTPHLLMEGHVSPHDARMRPSQAHQLARADLIVWVGPTLESAFSKAISQSPAKQVALMKDVVGLSVLKGATAHDGEAAHGHKEEHADTHAEDLATDPHIWLDPRNARKIVAHLSNVLAELDPANAPRYQRNAKAVDGKIRVLANKTTMLLEPVREVPFLVFHDGYGYLVDAFALNQRGSVTLGAHQAPGARHVGELIAKIKAEAIGCLFTEPQFSPKLAETLQNQTGIRLGTLDALGAALPAGGQLYVRMMQNNALALRECLSRPASGQPNG